MSFKHFAKNTRKIFFRKKKPTTSHGIENKNLLTINPSECSDESNEHFETEHAKIKGFEVINF